MTTPYLWVAVNTVKEDMGNLGINTAAIVNIDTKIQNGILLAQRLWESEGDMLTAPRRLVTETQRGSDSQSIILRYWPVNSVTSVEIIYLQASYTLLNWTLNKGLGIIENDKSFYPIEFPAGYRNIRTIYQVGYKIADIPIDITEAIKRFAILNVIELSNMDKSLYGKAYRLGNYSVSLDGPYLNKTQQLLDHANHIRDINGGTQRGIVPTSRIDSVVEIPD